MGVDVDPKVRDETIVASDAAGVQSAVAQLSTRITIRDIGSPLALQQRIVAAATRYFGSAPGIEPCLKFVANLRIARGDIGGFGRVVFQVEQLRGRATLLAVDIGQHLAARIGHDGLNKFPVVGSQCNRSLSGGFDTDDEVAPFK